MFYTNKNKRTLLLLIGGIMLFAAVDGAKAQTQLKIDVITAGGGVANGSMVLHGSVGQPLTMASNGSVYHLKGGFWNAVYSTGTPTAISPDQTGKDLPDSFELDQAYPNPFNPETVIRYALPEAVKVRLTVYNMLGQQVSVLVHQKQSAGHHKVTFKAGQLSSGIYIYRIEAGDFISVKKMTLVK